MELEEKEKKHKASAVSLTSTTQTQLGFMSYTVLLIELFVIALCALSFDVYTLFQKRGVEHFAITSTADRF